MKQMNKFLYGTKWLVMAAITIALTSTTSCKKKVSEVTGQSYNNPKWGGFMKNRYDGQEQGPGLVLVEGGSFVMGSTENDLMYDHSNVERKVTVNSFYMDETEVSNVHYREYLYWVQRVFEEYPEVGWAALPDTLAWRSKLGFNEPFVDYYFRHPAYQEYPVVGISWQQANDFASWRTDRVNEMILDREGVVNFDVMLDASGDNNMNTRAYMANQYEFTKVNSKSGLFKKKSPLRDYRQRKKNQIRGHASMEDGILCQIIDFQQKLSGNMLLMPTSEIHNLIILKKEIFAWNDYTVRIKDGKEAIEVRFV